MKYTKTILLMLWWSVFILTGCEKDKEESKFSAQPGEIVRVNDTVLTEDDLVNLMPEGELAPLEIRDKRLFIKRWIETELLCQEALNRKIHKDPRVQARVKNQKRQFLSNHMLFLAMREKIKVTPEEIENYFDQHREEYVNEYRVKHILVNTREEAEEVIDLLGKHSFEWVANRYSVDPEAGRGGDLGYLTKGNMIPAFEEVIFDMKPGEVSGIIESDFGFHVIKMVGMREALARVGLDDVKEQIMSSLVMEKRKRFYSEFMDSLWSSSEIIFSDTMYRPRESVETK